MSTQTRIISSDGTGPKLNGTQLFFRTQTEYTIDNNGKVIDSQIRVYYTPYANGLVPGTGASSGWNPNAPGGLQQGGYSLAAYSADKGRTFSAFAYDQDDANAGRIPFGKNVGDTVLSPQAIASLNSPNGVLNQAINNSVINTAVNTQQGLAGQLSAKLQNTRGGTGGTPPPVTPPGAASPIDSTPIPVVTNISPTAAQKVGDYGNWIYPTGLGDNLQDYILFEMLEYAGRGDLSSLSPTTGLGQRQFNETKVLGRVILPIQPTISDINSVDWQNDSINPLQLLGAQLSLKGMQSGYTEADFAKLKDMATDPNVKSYLQQWFAGKAIGTNIFSRFSGAVVNPNVELLFNGPQLRPFNFSFRLSPRSEDEAKQVKGIIRLFKQGISIRRTPNNLFLKAPNVFKITYRNGQKPKTIGAAEEHTSLNKIKICALSQCSVDYTPDGSYATFYDDESTMTQYGLSLQFNELEPIFNEDYKELPKTTIGY